MRKDLENRAPAVVSNMLPKFDSKPKSVLSILKESGTSEHQPKDIKAVILSHLHFDHIGDFGKPGLDNAELWVGPSSCAEARPGYPLDVDSPVFSRDSQSDGARKIVEFELPSRFMDPRRGAKFADAVAKGFYEGIVMHKPHRGWGRLGSFDAAFDLFDDESLYVIDAPGHCLGHQMLLIRVKMRKGNSKDDFVLLAGDCFHHPAMLDDPLITARPTFSKASMHSDPERAIDVMFRAKRCTQEANIWVVGSHDFSVSHAIHQHAESIEGLVALSDWRQNGWKAKSMQSI